jgi:hypothetical protein
MVPRRLLVAYAGSHRPPARELEDFFFAALTRFGAGCAVTTTLPPAFGSRSDDVRRSTRGLVQAGACSSVGGTHATTRTARRGRTRTTIGRDAVEAVPAANAVPRGGATVTEASGEPDALRRIVGPEPALSVVLPDVAEVTGPTFAVNVLVEPPGPVAVSRTFR